MTIKATVVQGIQTSAKVTPQQNILVTKGKGKQKTGKGHCKELEHLD